MLRFSISLEDDPKLKDQTEENAEYVVKAIFTGIENDTAWITGGTVDSYDRNDSYMKTY